MDGNKLLLSAAEAAAILSISRAKFYSMDADGTLGPRGLKLGGRRLWRADELRAWVQADCPPRVKWLEMRRAAG